MWGNILMEWSDDGKTGLWWSLEDSETTALSKHNRLKPPLPLFHIIESFILANLWLAWSQNKFHMSTGFSKERSLYNSAISILTGSETLLSLVRSEDSCNLTSMASLSHEFHAASLADLAAECALPFLGICHNLWATRNENNISWV